MFSLFASNRFAARLGRMVVSGSLLLVMTIGLVGLPLTAPAPPKEGRFPCEQCPCGCATAAACWDKCCCHTDAEKLHWAAENGVTPPEFLVARFAASTGIASCSISQPKEKSCCSRCSKAAAADPTTEVAESTPLRLVQIESLAKCRGINLVWTLLSCMNVVTANSMLDLPEPPLLFVIPLVDWRADSFITSPEPPIP